MIPPLQQVIREEHLKSGTSSPLSSSLPEATGEAYSMSSLFRPESLTNLLGPDLLLNPLGAGDTCSAIFMLEYLDTRNATSSFAHALAAASASCLVIDSSSHFDKRIQKIVNDAIIIEPVIDLDSLSIG